MSWYTLQTSPNYENKVIQEIEKRMKEKNLPIHEIFSPEKTIIDYKNGKKIEIDLTTSVISITEDKRIAEFNDSATFDKFVENGFVDIKEKRQETDYVSFVKLVYTVDGGNYLHDIKLPMSMKSVEILFDFHKKTTLIYDPKNPENCIIDLGFIT